MKKVLITGYKGFIGANLSLALKEKGIEVIGFSEDNSIDELEGMIAKVDFIFHLAGINRPKKDSEFWEGNKDFTQILVDLTEKTGCKPILFSSSIQAKLDNEYGKSKKEAEDILFDYSKKNKVPVYVYRLNNVFGKWSRPNYNSVVATFCYNISRNIPVKISDKNKELELIYIDDIISDFISKVTSKNSPKYDKKIGKNYLTIDPKYKIKLGELKDILMQFKESRKSLFIPDFSNPFVGALYATYLSYLDKDNFSYNLECKTDERGELIEFLKSKDCGQFFILKVNPKQTRGNHYHHTKNEKFIVVSGSGIIKLQNTITKEQCEYNVSDKGYNVVETPPGWAHTLYNPNNNPLILVVWVSEVFDSKTPDTVYHEVK